MPSPEEINDQLKQLDVHRRSLAHMARQAARYGGEAEAPTQLFHSLADTRASIARIKGALRGWGVHVNDLPDDDAHPGAPATPPATPWPALPYPTNKVFVGREGELVRLAEWLARPHAVVAITGLGGVGKTQLATEFAHACADDTDTWPGGVFWVPMSSPAGVPTAVAAAGRALGVAGYDALPLPEQIQITRRAWAGPERHLLVFDNCEDAELLKQWRPTSGGARVLLTSRHAAWPPAAAQTLPLAQLPRPAALELLLASRAALLHTPADQLAADPAADTICEQLGDLALAIHMAAAYLAARSTMPLAGFLAELRAQSIDHAALRALDEDSPTAHIQHIAQTIELSYRLLGEDDRQPTTDDRRPMRDEGRMPEDEGELAVDHRRQTIDDERAATDEGRMTKDEGELATDAGRATKDQGELAADAAPPEPPVPNTQSLVPDTQSPIRDTQSPALDTPNSLARHILALAAHCAPGAPIPIELLRRATEDQGRMTNDQGRRTKDDAAIQDREAEDQGRTTNDNAAIQPLTPNPHSLDAALHRLVSIGLASYDGAGQALSIHRLVAAYARKQQDETTATELIETLALKLRRMTYEVGKNGLPAKMQPILPHAQHAAEAAGARGSQRAATLLNNLGSYFQDIAAYADARALYEHALRIGEASFGPDHPEVAINVNNLGRLAHEQGDLPLAKVLLQRALRIDEAAFGPDHPNVARDLNNLGMLAKDQGDLPTARSLYERALRIDEATFGPNHPNVAIRLNNLGRLAHDQGDLPAARTLYERALRIDEATFGPDHPAVAYEINNLGALAHTQGDLQAARDYLDRALAIFERELGDSHPNVATLINNLAMVATDQGDLPTARTLYERALRIDEAAFGPLHPKVAIRLNNLGMLAHDQGNLPAARAYLERALRINEQALGADHPSTRITRDNLASVLAALAQPPRRPSLMARLRAWLGRK